MEVEIEKNGAVWTVIINRPEVRNAVDGKTAKLLFEAFKEFEADDSALAGVLWGAGGHFCAGADLKTIASGDVDRINPLNMDLDDCAPMGPTRLSLSKPVIAAVSGYAVAGGLELACWCDIRVAEESAVFGVFCRRYGVPLIDGGTVRLPAIVGLGRALDIILTGRPVDAWEALNMGLVSRVVPDGKAREEAEKMGLNLSKFPQTCLKGDLKSARESVFKDYRSALEYEFAQGLKTLEAGEALRGAAEFERGKGKHGKF